MLISRQHVPTSRLMPLQFRKIWKKLITLQIGRGKGARKMWRSIFGTIFSLGGVYAIIGLITPTAEPVNMVVLLSPLLGLFFALVFLLAIYQWLYLWTYFYDLDEHFIRIRKGVIIRREVTIPYNRIHDVYLDQDVLDHIFQLYDLYLATASEISYEETHIDGLNRRNGQRLRNQLLEKIQNSRPLGLRRN